MKPQIPGLMCCQFGLFMTGLQTDYSFHLNTPSVGPPRRFKKNVDIKGGDPQNKPARFFPNDHKMLSNATTEMRSINQEGNFTDIRNPSRNGLQHLKGDSNVRAV